MAALVALLIHPFFTHAAAPLLGGILLPLAWRHLVRPALIWVIATALD